MSSLAPPVILEIELLGNSQRFMANQANARSNLFSMTWNS